MDEKYRKQMIESVKALGQEVIDRAEDLVGTVGLTCDFQIVLDFPNFEDPKLMLKRSCLSKRWLELQDNK